MMRTAIISDIHGNLPALQAVLADIKKQGADEIVCLGDIVGYGPHPVECLQTVYEHAEKIVLGNHDQAASFDGQIGFNPIAKASMFWTRDMIAAAEDGQQLLHKLQTTPDHYVCESDSGDTIMYVHACPSEDPFERVNTYVEYVSQAHNIKAIPNVCAQLSELPQKPRIAFIGHTHVPFFYSQKDEYEEGDRQSLYVGHAANVLINVGSVGQPRDESNESSYVISDGKEVEFYRVPYDIKATRDALTKVIPDMVTVARRQGVLITEDKMTVLAKRLEVGW